MELRPLVLASGALATAVLLPLVVAFALAGRPDIVRGLLLGLVIGLLNGLLLARKLDRVIDGREPWQALRRTMPRNMMVRFSLIIIICVAASQVRGIHMAAVAGGLALYLVVSLVYSAWSVAARWKKEDGPPIYGKAPVVRS